MNKNFRVVTINGIRGMIVAIFICLGLIAGFVISPGFVCMKIWNYFAQDSFTFSTMNIYQGILAWSIIALALFAVNNKKSLIGIGSYQGITPNQMQDIIKQTRNNEAEIIKEIENRIRELAKEQEEKVSSEVTDFNTQKEEQTEQKETQSEEVRR